MTLAGKFTDVLPNGQGAHLGGHVHVDSVSTHAPPGAIIVPDAHLLFTGDFKRAGVDLVLSGDGRELVLHDYFKGEKRAALASTDGAHLTGDIVNALTGHTQLAQADGSPSVAQVIGHVTKLVGTATAIRNGVSIILNQGDNVNKGDVVQSGSGSSLGITFIDGSVFGLASNAKMVLNEMIYDPNGSNNSSLISLVQGTISFVAGGTAKKGDMKVDTPVATMGIRGTAVLVEIDFVVPGQGGAPPARFQVLVEPDGTTGSYILFDKTTLTPIATVNQAGTQTIVNGQGTVNFLSSVQLSPDAQKIISDVFQLKFTDLNNPQSLHRFTDSPVPETTFVRTASGENVTVTARFAQVADPSAPSTGGTPTRGQDHIPGPPDVVTTNAAFTERTGLTGSSTSDTVTGEIRFADINAGDQPTAQATFDSFKYENAQHNDVTASLTAEQIAAIRAVEVPLVVLQDPANKNTGTATWTYDVRDGAFDFLAAGETLTLTYMARVDNNFAQNNEITFRPITITITGTNDVPTVATSGGIVIERIGTGNTAVDTITGTVTFTDADLTDRPVVSATLSTTEPFKYLDAEGHNVTAGLTAAQLAAIAAVKIPLSVVQGAGNSHNGSATWTYSIADHAFDFIAKDETLILNYVIQVSDGHGGVVSTPVSISINGADVTVVGTNDTPTITSGLQTGTIGELVNTHNSPALDHASGTIQFTDVDLTDTHHVTITNVDASGVETGLAGYTAQLGWLSLGEFSDTTGGVTGSQDWTFSASDQFFDYLAVGESVTLNYTVEIDDLHGGIATEHVVVTINGSNDAPVAVADIDTGHIVEAGNDSNNNVLAGVSTTTGDVLANDTDLDLSDTHHVIGVGRGTLSGMLTTGVGATINGTYGGLVLNENGTWTYTLDNSRPATDALAQGAQASDIFSYTESDGHGGTSTTTLTVNITGTNDTPVANAAPVAATDVNAGTPVSERGVSPGNTEFAGVDTASGNVLANDLDVDTGDTKTVQGVASGTQTGPLTGHVASVVAGTYGSVTIDANGAWTYTLNNSNAATQALTQGEHAFDVFTYTMHDAHGATASATLTIDVTGTNDAPTLTSVAAGLLTDTAGNDSFGNLTGTLVGYDPDHGQTASLNYGAIDPISHLAANYAIAGHYGSLTVNANGTYSYVADVNAINALHAGSYVDTFTVQTVDVNGAIGTASLTVDVIGTDDVPMTIAEAAFIAGNARSVSGNLLANDTDAEGDPLSISSVDHASVAAGRFTVQGTYGELVVSGATGDDTYTLGVSPAQAAAVAALAQGTVGHELFTYTVSDGTLETVEHLAVTVTGSNDAPSILGATDAPAQAVMVVNPISPVVLVQGANTNSLGLITETFDSQSAGSSSNNGAGHGDFQNAALDASFSASGNAGIVNGSSSVTAAPFVGPFPGGQDTTNYLSIGGNGIETITFASAKNAFGLYWGSLDPYNTIKFYDGTTLIASYTGADISPLFPSGNQGSFASNGYVEFAGLHSFNKVVLGTGSSNAFEIDNISAGIVAPAHAVLAAPITGVLNVHDADIGDTLTASVTHNATIDYNGSSTLPAGIDVAALVDAGDITFDSVISDGGADVLHWSYRPTNANLDFLHAGDVLKIKFAAEVSDGHGNVGSQPLTVTLVGANSTTDVSTFSAVNGTSGNDTFSNVGGNATIFGGGGHDTFVFNFGFDRATIADFDVNNDRIEISKMLFGSVADVLAAAAPVNSGHDTVITDTSHNTITLKGVAVAQLQSFDFHLF